MNIIQYKYFIFPSTNTYQAIRFISYSIVPAVVPLGDEGLLEGPPQDICLLQEPVRVVSTSLAVRESREERQVQVRQHSSHIETNRPLYINIIITETFKIMPR